VDYFLHGKTFSINRNHNAKAMEQHAKEVSAILGAAKKAKKKVTVKIRPVSSWLTLADATRAFHALSEFETPESGAEASPATFCGIHVDKWP
jgi:cobalamin-dependent methionine synthase I